LGHRKGGSPEGEYYRLGSNALHLFHVAEQRKGAPFPWTVPRRGTVIHDRGDCSVVKLSNLLRPDSAQAFDGEALPYGFSCHPRHVLVELHLAVKGDPEQLGMLARCNVLSLEL
jgi:hypothetical protein